MAITASEARKNLFPLIQQVNDDRAPVEITSKNGRAVLISADEWEAWQETAYLFRSPANARRLLDAATALDESIDRAIVKRINRLVDENGARTVRRHRKTRTTEVRSRRSVVASNHRRAPACLSGGRRKSRNHPGALPLLNCQSRYRMFSALTAGATVHDDAAATLGGVGHPPRVRLLARRGGRLDHEVPQHRS